MVILIFVYFYLCLFAVTSSNPLSVSQMSPKSDSLQALDNDNLQASISQAYVAAASTSSHQHEPLASVAANSSPAHYRVERSASPILHDNEHASKIVFVDDNKQRVDTTADDDQVSSGRYFNAIQPTSSLSTPNDIHHGHMTKSERAAKDLSDKSSFLLKGGPRSIPSGSPSKPLDSAANATMSQHPSSVTPATAALTAMRPLGSNAAAAGITSGMTNNNSNGPRQSPNPDIQDIITGIVKLLNGKVNVHANTQLQPPVSRRPYTTRINNRGPPRISDAQSVPADNYDGYDQQPPQQQPSLTSTLRPPPQLPYIFDRPDTPMRPFMSGVPIPEQKVPPPPNGNYRPGYMGQPQQNRPPWQRPRPRPPIVTNTNIRPILTPPPYKFTIPTSSPSLQQDEYYAEDDLPETITDAHQDNADTAESPQEVSATHHNVSYEVNEHQQELLANEEYPDGNQEQAQNEAPKKNAKRPTNVPEPSEPVIQPTQSSDIQMTTIIQTASEIRTSQHIPASLLTPDLSTLQPSEELPVRISPSDIHLLETTATPSLKPSRPPQVGPTESKIVPKPFTTRQQPTPAQSTQQSVSPVMPSSFPTFHARPGIVLDDPEFKPGGHARPNVPTTPLYTNVQPTRVPQHPSHPPHHPHQQPQPQKPQLPPGYGEIFDVTLSAIQGGGGGGHSGLQTVNIKPYGAGQPGDIIVSPSGDDGFVSIDGKRTYINLFGEATTAPTGVPAIAPTSTAAAAAAAHKTQAIKPSQVVRHLPWQLDISSNKINIFFWVHFSVAVRSNGHRIRCRRAGSIHQTTVRYGGTEGHTTRPTEPTNASANRDDSGTTGWLSTTTTTTASAHRYLYCRR